MLQENYVVTSSSCFIHVREQCLIIQRSNSCKISNKLGNGLDLTLRCKSKDDDLGVHLLHQDESFSFQFHPNIFRSTLFWCSFRWSGQTKSFDIFDGGRDYLLTDLKWSASPTQICDENKKVCYDYNKLRVTT